MPRKEAILFLTELDKADRIADSIAERIEVNCPHDVENALTPGDFVEALEDALEPDSASKLRKHLKALIAEVLADRDVSDLLGD